MTVIYHHNDTDGHVSAGITRTHILNKDKNEKVLLVESDYSNPLDTSILSSGDEVYIVDLSFTNNTIDNLHDIAKIVGYSNITWIDHHASSIDITNNEIDTLVKGIRTDLFCASVLCYIWFSHSTENLITRNLMDRLCKHDKDYINERLPLFIKYVNRGDTFTDMDDEVRSFMLAYVYSYNPDIENTNFWNSIVNHSDSAELSYAYIETGKKLLQYQKSRDNSIQNDIFLASFKVPKYKDVCIPFLNTPHSGSDQFGYLYDTYPAVCRFCYSGPDKGWNFTVYSHDKSAPFCKEIAEYFGGGGHNSAAGFGGIRDLNLVINN